MGLHISDLSLQEDLGWEAIHPPGCKAVSEAAVLPREEVMSSGHPAATGTQKLPLLPLSWVLNITQGGWPGISARILHIPLPVGHPFISAHRYVTHNV